jgi:hypothetical protein
MEKIDDIKILVLRRDGVCGCGVAVPRGVQAGWHRTLRVVVCARCLESGDVTEASSAEAEVEIGRPGASLDREYARRMRSREVTVRAAHPVIGGLLLLLAGPRHTTEAFRIGAEGERQVAAALERAGGGDVLFLYNRRRGTGAERGDIDMLAIAPSGVHIIDPKKYVGRKIRATVRGDEIVVDGRKHTGLSASMRRQIAVVTAAVQSGPQSQAPVHAAYCFLGADLPWRTLVVGGVPVLGIRGVKRLLDRPGPLDAVARGALHADLARRFPPA